MKTVPVTVAYGDGIGPEIMEATIRIITEAGAALELERIEIGESVYNRGIEQRNRARTRGNRCAAPRSFSRRRSPRRKAAASRASTSRCARRLGMYANVRPCSSLHPYVSTKHPNMDIVIIRENEEDVYGGIEHRQTNQVAQCLKLISRPGSKRIIRYAFEYARANKRKKVTCFTKDNIMKITDGLFHRTFDEIAKSTRRSRASTGSSTSARPRWPTRPKRST